MSPSWKTGVPLDAVSVSTSKRKIAGVSVADYGGAEHVPDARRGRRDHPW